MDRSDPQYLAWVNRKVDVVAAIGVLAGAGLISYDWRMLGWLLTIVSTAVLFQRIRELDKS